MREEFNLGRHKFRVENIDTVTVKRDKGYRYSYRNGRGKHGFVYIESGKMRDDFEGEYGESVELFPGDLIFIPKGCAYVGNYLEDSTAIKIVQFDIFSGELPRYLEKPIKIELPDAKERIEAFFDASEIGPDSAFYFFSCIYGLLWQIERRCFDIPSKYRKIKKALVELSTRFESNAPVSFYAELCDMSEVNFRRLFREYTGKSPVEYRNDVRLDAARARIKSCEYNVTEAAESVGFSNLSFFIKLYKRKFGNTPKKE